MEQDQLASGGGLCPVGISGARSEDFGCEVCVSGGGEGLEVDERPAMGSGNYRGVRRLAYRVIDGNWWEVHLFEFQIVCSREVGGVGEKAVRLSSSCGEPR